MNQEKIGSLIKEIRRKNNLTQKELARKLGVTYQAVSKWENGRNIPDISLLKQMSEDFDIDLNDFLEGNNEKKKQKKSILWFVLGTIIILATIIFIYFHDKNFEFKTLSSTCSTFTIKGTIAYNKSKSSIHISNIEYCGGENNEVYERVECALYEKNGDTKTLISKLTSSNKKTKLEDYLKEVEIKISDYERTCAIYSDHSLYLEIKAYRSDEEATVYDVPLHLDDECTN